MTRALFERLPRLADLVPFTALADGLPTPVETVDSRLWVQREEHTSSAYGGNKVRKFEFLFAVAERRGGPLLTAGGVGSHHVLAAAVHAQRAATWSARRLSRASIEYAATTKTGETMTEPAEKSELIVYENVDTAPFVYFDISPTHGVLGGAIQIELAARILNAVPDGGVEIKFITTGRLRCSPTAALNLRHAIDAALKMLEQPQQSPVAAAKMN